MEVLYRREADVIFFNQLAIDSVMYQVASKVPWFLCRSHFPAFQIHWQTSISGEGGVERKWVSKKHQRDIARCKRNLEKASSGSVEIVCYRKETDIDYIMDVISEISAWTYKAGIGAQFVDNSLMRSLLQQAARDGWLRAYIMYAGNVPIAYETGAVCDKVYFAEHAGFDPRWKAYGPGTMLQLGIFEDLSANESVDVYDYGFGDAIYKRRFGSKSWPEVSVYIFSRRLYPILLNVVDSLIRGTSLVLASLAGKLDLKSKVTRYWRDYLQRRSRQQKKESEEQ
jgi:hypothetical protein